jgi:tetratricopeptide (TPR) repeat protein
MRVLAWLAAIAAGLSWYGVATGTRPLWVAVGLTLLALYGLARTRRRPDGDALADGTREGRTWVRLGHLSHEEARAIQDAAFDAMSDDDRNSPFNQAARLMTSKRYAEAIAAFEAIERDDPSERESTQLNIGAARFFLGEYDRAIEHYIAARDAGANAETIDDNVWEACEKLLASAADASSADAVRQRYRTLCPDGKYDR